MADELVFYTNPMSRGRIVRWMLEEVGQPYCTEVLEFGPAMKGAAYRSVNPMGKVPAIRHRGVVVTECAAICAYLADAFPDAGLAPPPASPLRGPYYRWLFFGAGPVEMAATDKALGHAVPEGQEGRSGYGRMSDVLDALEAAVTGRQYLVGDSFTAADVYLGAQIGWMVQYGAIEPRPAFTQYCSGLVARPAWARAQQIDDALLPPRAPAG